MVALFALFQGYAHGMELPSAGDPVGYSLGSVVATGLLHLVGIGIGFISYLPRGRLMLRGFGSACRRAVVLIRGDRVRGGLLPPLMLCLALALALALAFVPRRIALGSAALAAVIAVVVWLLRPPATWTELVFVGCWLSVIATAGLSYWPEGLPTWLAPFIAANFGLWAGAVSAVAGSSADLVLSLALILLAVPAGLIIERGGSIALKIASSWLIAVATLAAIVSLRPTPGYAQDHKD